MQGYQPSERYHQEYWAGILIDYAEGITAWVPAFRLFVRPGKGDPVLERLAAK
jgi:hypothetical protein